MSIIVRYGPSVLFPDRSESGQFSDDIFPDLGSGRHEHGSEAGGIVNKQLRPRLPPEDRILHPAPRCRHIKALTVPVEPVGLRCGRPSRRIPATTTLRGSARNASILSDDAIPTR